MGELWIALGCMVIFLLGFFVGRKIGLGEGLELGFMQAPLEIKKRSLENGHCQICGITKNFQDIAG